MKRRTAIAGTLAAAVGSLPAATKAPIPALGHPRIAELEAEFWDMAFRPGLMLHDLAVFLNSIHRPVPHADDDPLDLIECVLVRAVELARDDALMASSSASPTTPHRVF